MCDNDDDNDNFCKLCLNCAQTVSLSNNYYVVKYQFNFKYVLGSYNQYVVKMVIICALNYDLSLPPSCPSFPSLSLSPSSPFFFLFCYHSAFYLSQMIDMTTVSLYIIQSSIPVMWRSMEINATLLIMVHLIWMSCPKLRRKVSWPRSWRS